MLLLFLPHLRVFPGLYLYFISSYLREDLTVEFSPGPWAVLTRLRPSLWQPSPHTLLLPQGLCTSKLLHRKILISLFI